MKKELNSNIMEEEIGMSFNPCSNGMKKERYFMAACIAVIWL